MRCGSFDTLCGALMQDIRRTEEQKSRNLHDHMPYCCEQCSTSCTSACRFCVRNKHCKLPKHVTGCAEDYVHKKLHHAEVRAELVRFARPDIVFADAQDKQGHITSDHSFQSPMTTSDMFVAFQQRCVQTRWMSHSFVRLLPKMRQVPFFPFLRVCGTEA